MLALHSTAMSDNTHFDLLSSAWLYGLRLFQIIAFSRSHVLAAMAAFDGFFFVYHIRTFSCLLELYNLVTGQYYACEKITFISQRLFYFYKHNYYTYYRIRRS